MQELLNTAAAGKFVRNQTACDELTWLLTTTLEPGGYLMWVEHNPTNTRIESISPELKSDAWQFIQGLSDGCQALRKLRFGIRFLTTHFPSQSLERVKADTYN